MFVKLHRPPPEMRIFSPMRRIVLEHDHGSSALAGLDGAHQARRACADNNHVMRFIRQAEQIIYDVRINSAGRRSHMACNARN